MSKRRCQLTRSVARPRTLGAAFIHVCVLYYTYSKKVKVKCSRYRPGVAQRVGRDIALLFHDRGTRRGWVVSSTSRPHFAPGKDPVPILQEAGWAPGPVWTGGNSRPHRHSIPDRPARSHSLYRLSYPAHIIHTVHIYINVCISLKSSFVRTTKSALTYLLTYLLTYSMEQGPSWEAS